MIAKVPTHEGLGSLVTSKGTKAASGEALLAPFVLTEHTLVKGMPGLHVEFDLRDISRFQMQFIEMLCRLLDPCLHTAHLTPPWLTLSSWRPTLVILWQR